MCISPINLPRPVLVLGKAQNLAVGQQDGNPNLIHLVFEMPKCVCVFFDWVKHQQMIQHM